MSSCKEGSYYGPCCHHRSAGGGTVHPHRLGALGAKTGLLRPEGKQTLSNLLVNLVVPAMIINSYRMEFSAEILHNLMAAFA